MVSDGGGAVVIASADMARNARKKPVWIIGTGEATKYRENGGDITVSAGAQSGPIAFAEAGVSPSEIDILMAYDSFSITVMCLIEDLGFCGRGEGGAFTEGGALIAPNGRLPLNTHGGQHSEAFIHGFNNVIEAVRQIRGVSTSQVPDARAVVVIEALTDPCGAFILRSN